MVVAMRPDHPLARKRFISAEDFAGEHLIVYNAPKEDLTILQKVLIPAGIVPREFTQIELTEAIVEMVKAGMGVSVVAQWAVAPQVESKALQTVRLTRSGFRRTWYAGMLQRVQPDYLRDFVRILSANPTTDSPSAVLP
jgi:LysR family transcriptional regulator for metE and metH